MQQVMHFLLWLRFITIINCKFSGDPKNSLEWNRGTESGEKIELETLNSSLNVKQFEPFTISVDVTVNSRTGNYSSVEVRSS